MAPEIVGKNVQIVDDSSVRGTRSREIIQIAEVRPRTSVQKGDHGIVRNVYDIGVPSRAELVADCRTTDAAVDLVSFQTLLDLVTSRFECPVYDGKYATGGVDAAHPNRFEGVHSDNMKTKAAAVVNGLASAHSAAVVEAVVEVGDTSTTAGASGTNSGSESTGIPSTHWPADRAVGLHNT
ncbi:hypothetical protein EDB85DRAFT_2145775 [Lactarius pseudohatsudake]|nr:hypothetical protein EDB85DRAFT_2145775 [Lactarius pseudohatsudake]